jgi:hypothetical protein
MWPHAPPRPREGVRALALLALAAVAFCGCIPHAAAVIKPISLTPATPLPVFDTNIWTVSEQGCQSLRSVPLADWNNELAESFDDITLPFRPQGEADRRAKACPTYSYGDISDYVPSDRDWGVYAGPGLFGLQDSVAAVDTRAEKIYTVEHEAAGTYTLVSRTLAATASSTLTSSTMTRTPLSYCAPLQMTLVDYPALTPVTAPRSRLMFLCSSPQRDYNNDGEGPITPNLNGANPAVMSLRSLNAGTKEDMVEVLSSTDLANLGVEYVAIGVSAFDETHGDLLFVGLSSHDDILSILKSPVRKVFTSWRIPHIYALNLATGATGEVSLDPTEVNSVQSFAWASQLAGGVIILLTETELRILPLSRSISLETGSVVSTLPVSTIHLGFKAASTNFLLADMITEFEGVQSSQMKWVEDSSSVLFAVRHSNGNTSLVSVELLATSTGDSYTFSATALRRTAVDESPAVIAGTMSPLIVAGSVGSQNFLDRCGAVLSNFGLSEFVQHPMHFYLHELGGGNAARCHDEICKR